MVTNASEAQLIVTLDSSWRELVQVQLLSKDLGYPDAADAIARARHLLDEAMSVVLKTRAKEISR